MLLDALPHSNPAASGSSASLASTASAPSVLQEPPYLTHLVRHHGRPSARWFGTRADDLRRIDAYFARQPRQAAQARAAAAPGQDEAAEAGCGADDGDRGGGRERRSRRAIDGGWTAAAGQCATRCTIGCAVGLATGDGALDAVGAGAVNAARSKSCTIGSFGSFRGLGLRHRVGEPATVSRTATSGGYSGRTCRGADAESCARRRCRTDIDRARDASSGIVARSRRSRTRRCAIGGRSQFGCAASKHLG